jgi:hypothetical protein
MAGTCASVALAGGLAGVLLILAVAGPGMSVVGRAEMEGVGSARQRYNHAEKVMSAALAKAHDYEHRAAEQTRLEKTDERMHYELVKAARDHADELRRQDRKVSKVSDVRMRMEDAVRATSGVLNLHEKRLEDLMAEERADTVKARREQQDVDELKKSAHDMKESVQHLEEQTIGLKKQFQQEVKDTSMTKTSKDLEHMLSLFSSKQASEVGREKRAEEKAHQATASAHKKQAEALRLQARADLIQKELVSMGCKYGGKGVDGSKCDPGKKVSLDDEYSTLKRQIEVLEQEVVYEHKQGKVMDSTARLQQQMAETDGYKATSYRNKLKGSQQRLEALRKDLVMAPQQIKAAKLNLELASQAAQRVNERLRIIREKRQTDFAEVSKAKALARLQAREIGKIKRLKRSQEQAVLTAARAQEAQGDIVASQSQRVQRLMAESRALQKDALAHSQVAARWDSAATLEMKEASAYAQVAQEISQGHRWQHVAADTSRQASQMRHGLQLMAVESAIRHFRNDPSDSNRRELERLEKLLEDRLGRADDATENQASIQELNTIEDELDGLDRPGAPHRGMGAQSAPRQPAHEEAAAEAPAHDPPRGRAAENHVQPRGYMYTTERGPDGRMRRGRRGRAS